MGIVEVQGLYNWKTLLELGCQGLYIKYVGGGAGGFLWGP